MSSAFGLVSRAWNALTGSFYFTAQNAINYGLTTLTIPGTDAANLVPQCGVYMINGNSEGSATPPTAIPTSVSNLSLIGIAGGTPNGDDGFILYPNFGIQAFKGINYTDASSVITYNTTSEPLFVASGTNSYPGYPVYLVTNTSTNTPYSTTSNQTFSIKVFYQGKQITTLGLS